MRSVLKAYLYGKDRYYIDDDLNKVKCIDEKEVKEVFQELLKIGHSPMDITMFIYSVTSEYNLPIDDRLLERLAALRSLESKKDICILFNDFLNRPKLYTLTKAYCGLTIAPIRVDIRAEINNKNCLLPQSCVDLMFAEINEELLSVTEISELLDKLDFPIITNKENDIVLLKSGKKIELCPISEEGTEIDLDRIAERVTKVNKSKMHKELVKCINTETGYFEEEILTDCYKIEIKDIYKDVLFRNTYK